MPVARPPGDELAQECIHHRLLPGDGHGNIAALLSELTARGVDAPICIEVFSDALNTLEANVVARRAMDSFNRVSPAQANPETHR